MISGRAIAWHQTAFELGDPDVFPMEGLAELDLGSFWLQLALVPEHADVDGVSVNLRVGDAGGERQKLADLGLAVTEVQRFEGVVDFFGLTDLDGNKIGFVTELA